MALGNALQCCTDEGLADEAERVGLDKEAADCGHSVVCPARAVDPALLVGLVDKDKVLGESAGKAVDGNRRVAS